MWAVVFYLDCEPTAYEVPVYLQVFHTNQLSSKICHKYDLIAFMRLHGIRSSTEDTHLRNVLLLIPLFECVNIFGVGAKLSANKFPTKSTYI